MTDKELPDTHVITVPRVGSEYKHEPTDTEIFIVDMVVVEKNGIIVTLISKDDEVWRQSYCMEEFDRIFSPHTPKPKKKVPVARAYMGRPVRFDCIGRDFFLHGDSLYRKVITNNAPYAEYYSVKMQSWMKTDVVRDDSWVIPVESVEWREVEVEDE